MLSLDSAVGLSDLWMLCTAREWILSKTWHCPDNILSPLTIERGLIEPTKFHANFMCARNTKLKPNYKLQWEGGITSLFSDWVQYNSAEARKSQMTPTTSESFRSHYQRRNEHYGPTWTCRRPPVRNSRDLLRSQHLGILVGGFVHLFCRW